MSWRSKALSLACAGIFAAQISACSSGSSTSSGGSGGSGTVEVNSLSAVPDLSGIVDNSSASSSSFLRRLAVVGTPPAYSSITSDDIGTYFFGTLLDDDIPTDPQLRGEFYHDFFNGMSKCQLMASSARAFAMIEESSTTMCYMKNVAASAELSFTRGDASQQATALTTGEEDKTLKLTISGMHDGEGEGEDQNASQTVIIKTVGSNNTTNTYEAYVFMCKGEGNTPTEYNKIVVDANGVLSYVSSHNDSGHGGTFSSQVSVSGELESDGSGGYQFKANTAKNMSAVDSFSGTFSFGDQSFTVDDTFNANLAISSTQVELMMLMKHNQNNGYFLNKVYSLTNYTGSNLHDVKFPSGAMAQSMGEYDTNNQLLWQPTDFEGNPIVPVTGAEYQESASPRYQNESSSDNYTTALTASGSFDATLNSNISSGTSFNYATVRTPENDVETIAAAQGVSCDMTADIEASMDFTAPANQAIGTLCEPEVNRGDSDRICENAWNKINQMSDD